MELLWTRLFYLDTLRNFCEPGLRHREIDPK